MWLVGTSRPRAGERGGLAGMEGDRTRGVALRRADLAAPGEDEIDELAGGTEVCGRLEDLLDGAGLEHEAELVAGERALAHGFVAVDRVLAEAVDQRERGGLSDALTEEEGQRLGACEVREPARGALHLRAAHGERSDEGAGERQ